MDIKPDPNGWCGGSSGGAATREEEVPIEDIISRSVASGRDRTSQFEDNMNQGLADSCELREMHSNAPRTYRSALVRAPARDRPR